MQPNILIPVVRGARGMVLVRSISALAVAAEIVIEGVVELPVGSRKSIGPRND